MNNEENKVVETTVTETPAKKTFDTKTIIAGIILVVLIGIAIYVSVK